MQFSGLPAKFPRPFGASAGASYIRPIPDTTSDPAAASFTNAFPPSTFTDVSAGGTPMDGRDMNGILNAITAWLYYLQAGAITTFDAGIAAAGGYPKYAMLASMTPGVFWQSSADNNTTNPDGGSASNWLRVSPLPASAADVKAGTDNTKYVTPASLRSAMQANIANPGYRIGSDGFIQQWALGRYDGPGNAQPSQTIAFPTSFQTACLGVMVTTQISAPNGNTDVWYQLVGAPSLSACTVQNQVSTNGSNPLGSTPAIYAWGF